MTNADEEYAAVEELHGKFSAAINEMVAKGPVPAEDIEHALVRTALSYVASAYCANRQMHGAYSMAYALCLGASLSFRSLPDMSIKERNVASVLTNIINAGMFYEELDLTSSNTIMARFVAAMMFSNAAETGISITEFMTDVMTHYSALQVGMAVRDVGGTVQ